MWEQADQGANKWALRLITEPPVEPLTLQEAKTHLREDLIDTNNDAYISGLITAARQVVEERTARALITQTWDLILDDFPTGDTITVRKPMLQSVENVYYTNSDGIELTMPTTDYVVDTASVPGRVFLGFSKIWPVVVLQPASAVRVRFTSGYGDTADKVPQPIKNAMLFLIGHWYINRRIVEVKNRYAMEIPKTFDILIGPYKVWRFL